jgi:glycosyltransferase involved in cell wall biosynthesis
LNDPAFAAIPVLIYFHESQWTYPTSPHSPVDHHYGYTNLLSAIAAEACVFNSRFHRDTFLEASERFVRRMPDSKSAHDWNQLKLKCHVIAPGIDLRDTAWSRTHQANDAVRETLKAPLPTRSKVIGWVSRWESDKRPDRFANMLRDLARQDQNFQLILLGARTGISGRSPCEALEKIRRDHGDRILYDGFAPTAPEYWHWLSKMDFVVSTADHEFFGIAICEAMHAGVIPVVPNRLSYPELVPPDCLYESSEEAIAMLCKSEDTRQSLTAACRACANRFDRKQTARMIDERVDRLIVNHRIGRT